MACGARDPRSRDSSLRASAHAVAEASRPRRRVRVDCTARDEVAKRLDRERLSLGLRETVLEGRGVDARADLVEAAVQISLDGELDHHLARHLVGVLLKLRDERAIDL